MSTPVKSRRPEAPIMERPVKPGSALYRILEMVAERIVERLQREASKSDDDT